MHNNKEFIKSVLKVVLYSGKFSTSMYKDKEFKISTQGSIIFRKIQYLDTDIRDFVIAETQLFQRICYIREFDISIVTQKERCVIS